MNFFEFIYDFNAFLGIIMFVFLIILTMYAYKSEHNPSKKKHLILSLVVELILLVVLLFTIRSFSTNTKTVIGAVDVLGWFF